MVWVNREPFVSIVCELEFTRHDRTQPIAVKPLWSPKKQQAWLNALWSFDCAALSSWLQWES